MRPTVRALRDAAVQAAQRQGVRFQEFLDRGLEDILGEAEQQNWSVQEMATQLLEGAASRMDGSTTSRRPSWPP